MCSVYLSISDSPIQKNDRVNTGKVHKGEWDGEGKYEKKFYISKNGFEDPLGLKSILTVPEKDRASSVWLRISDLDQME